MMKNNNSSLEQLKRINRMLENEDEEEEKTLKKYIDKQGED